jgi:uncharacterized protein (TIGR04255 family)
MTTPVVPELSYKKPPVIEAVIAIHLSVPLEMKWIDSFALKRKTSFPHSEDVIEMFTSFNAQTTQSTSQVKKVGRKIRSADGTRVVSVWPNQIAFSQLPPYTNWETLRDEARENWDVLTKIAKHKSVARVSTRYINRIDIPAEGNGNVDLHKYFNVGLSLPSYAQSLHLQQFHINCALNHINGLKFQLQVVSTPSPLIDFMSFVIDIDLTTIDAVPSNEDKMWELIGSLRQYKNDLFESCITPETRKLFQ